MAADLMQLGGTADTALSTAYSVLKWVGVLVVLGLIFWWLYNRKQYKYDVKLKVFQNEQFVFHSDKAKQVVIDGATFWYLKKLKHRTVIPPASSLYLSTAGRWVAEGYFDREAGLLWSRDTVSKQEFMKIIERMKKTGEISGSGAIDTHYQPMTATERSLLAHQITKALTRKGKDIWAMIWQILPVVVLVIIFALILIFWGDIAKPVKELAASNAQISADNKLMQQQNIRLYQMLTGGKGNGTHYIVQQIAEDQQYFIPQFPGNAT